jgi:nucleosome binding factor SPN SPT16 subunit
LKGAFQGFIDKVVQQKNFMIEFESPFRPLGFHGTPHRSMVLIMPTTTCVVQLTEWVPTSDHLFLDDRSLLCLSIDMIVLAAIRRRIR